MRITKQELQNEMAINALKSIREQETGTTLLQMTKKFHYDESELRKLINVVETETWLLKVKTKFYYVITCSPELDCYYGDVFGFSNLESISDHTGIDRLVRLSNESKRLHLFDLNNGESELILRVVDGPGNYTKLTYQYLLDNHPEIIL